MNLTMQEIFDKSVKGVIAQGKPAVANDAQCAYRTPDGCKCAVGQLIPDDKYDPSWDAPYEPTLIDESTPQGEALRAALGGLNNDELALLSDLQAAHDNGSLDDDWLDKFKISSQSIAERWGLDY